jgi:hypothetical protein
MDPNEVDSLNRALESAYSSFNQNPTYSSANAVFSTGDGVLPRSCVSLVVLLRLWWYQHQVASRLAYAHSDCSGERRLKGGGRLRVNHQLLYRERRLAICSQLADFIYSVKVSDFSYQ